MSERWWVVPEVLTVGGFFGFALLLVAGTFGPPTGQFRLQSGGGAPRVVLGHDRVG